MKSKTYNTPVADLLKLDPAVPINLVLSGGGEKGVAHIALIEKIEALGLTINSISGCSAGSLVGAMYASGMRPQEILAFFKETPLFKYSWFSPTKPGIFNSKNYIEYLDHLVKKDFSELEIPLYIVATNLESYETYYFHQGEIMLPLLASCAVPAVFTPIKINDESYADGGIMDNFPILPFANSALPLVGSYLGTPTHKGQKELNSILKITQRVNHLMLYAQNHHKFFETDLTIEFPLDHLSSFDDKIVGEIYDSALTYLNESGLAHL